MSIDHTKHSAPVIAPDGVEYVEPEVRALAAGIAADIRRDGHWQDVHGVAVTGYCIVTAPSYRVANRSDGAGTTLEFLGRLEQLLVPGCEPFSGDVTDWNDTNPTDVVLARLDSIAEGLVAS